MGQEQQTPVYYWGVPTSGGSLEGNGPKAGIEKKKGSTLGHVCARTTASSGEFSRCSGPKRAKHIYIYIFVGFVERPDGESAAVDGREIHFTRPFRNTSFLFLTIPL